MKSNRRWIGSVKQRKWWRKRTQDWNRSRNIEREDDIPSCVPTSSWTSRTKRQSRDELKQDQSRKYDVMSFTSGHHISREEIKDQTFRMEYKDDEKNIYCHLTVHSVYDGATCFETVVVQSFGGRDVFTNILDRKHGTLQYPRLDEQGILAMTFQ
jgi:hypothetical protein